jgi:hypothetical protein
VISQAILFITGDLNFPLRSLPRESLFFFADHLYQIALLRQYLSSSSITRDLFLLAIKFSFSDKLFFLFCRNQLQIILSIALAIFFL